MVGIVVCCGDVGVVVCRGDVVVVWSLWFVVVTWQTCGGIALLASCFGTKEGVLTVIRSTETTNDDIVVVRCLVATSPTATWHLPSRLLWLALVRLVTCRCHVVLAVVVVHDGCA